MKTLDIELINKPDLIECMDRINAWFEGEILDRTPIRFHRHNSEYEDKGMLLHKNQKDRWFDAEYRVDEFRQSIKGMRFNAETFPIYCPNLGPNVYAAFHGGEMTFEDVTSWYHQLIFDYKDLEKLSFSKENVYYRKILELTKIGLEKAGGEFLVGYTDLHPGLDCALAWRGTEDLCMDLIMDRDNAVRLINLASQHFLEVYNEYDEILKAHKMPSASWMNIPVMGRFHIPSADFSFMISEDDFNELGLPVLKEEVKSMTHNVFHVDGKGVARHIDSILSVPEVKCIQWVQGVGDDYPIMQHLDFIRYVQSRNRGIIVDLSKNDLDAFMEQIDPKNIFLWIETFSEEEEIQIMKKVEKWSRKRKSIISLK